jgi:hypothetical protein
MQPGKNGFLPRHLAHWEAREFGPEAETGVFCLWTETTA